MWVGWKAAQLSLHSGVHRLPKMACKMSRLCGRASITCRRCSLEHKLTLASCLITCMGLKCLWHAPLHLHVCMLASLNVCIHLSIPPCVCLFVQCLLFTLCLCLCSSLCSCTNPRSLQHGRFTACVCAHCLICIVCAAGFLQQFAGVCQPDVPEKNMSSVIEQLSGGRIPTRVLCCGHSLGGALATLGMTYTAAVYDVSLLVCHCSLACLLLRDRPLPGSRGLARVCRVCCAARVSAMC